MTIDFEKDQQDAMKRTDNIQSLADQVQRLEAMQQQLEIQENALKEKKKQKSACKRIEITKNPWKRKVDRIKISSDDDSWDSIFMTDHDIQANKRHCKLPPKIIKDVNKMTEQNERVLEEMSKVKKSRHGSRSIPKVGDSKDGGTQKGYRDDGGI